MLKCLPRAQLGQSAKCLICTSMLRSRCLAPAMQPLLLCGERGFAFASCPPCRWVHLCAPGDAQACSLAQGFEGIYRRFDSTPGNTISIQGQVHVAVRTLLAKYGDDPSQGAITSITTTGVAPHHDQNFQSSLCLEPGLFVCLHEYFDVRGARACLFVYIQHLDSC